MNTIAERLKFARSKKGWTQGQLASAAGVSQGTIGNIESGARQSKASLIQICDALGANYKWLVFGQDTIEPKSNVLSALSRASVPLISLVKAAMLDSIDHINTRIPDGAVIVDAWHSSPSLNSFAVVVEGDSMTTSAGQSFPEGCTLIVDPARAAKAGDYVIARVGDGQPATFKRLVSDAGRLYLKPLNTAYPMTQIDDITCVVGVVIEWQVGGKL